MNLKFSTACRENNKQRNKKQRDSAFKILKKHYIQPRILYPAQLPLVWSKWVKVILKKKKKKINVHTLSPRMPLECILHQWRYKIKKKKKDMPYVIVPGGALANHQKLGALKTTEILHSSRG